MPFGLDGFGLKHKPDLAARVFTTADLLAYLKRAWVESANSLHAMTKIENRPADAGAILP